MVDDKKVVKFRERVAYDVEMGVFMVMHDVLIGDRQFGVYNSLDSVDDEKGLIEARNAAKTTLSDYIKHQGLDLRNAKELYLSLGSHASRHVSLD